MSADALELPPPFPPAGRYVHAVRAGDLLVLGGHIPVASDHRSIVQGKLGEDLELDDGREAARLAARSALATLQAELGSLDRIDRLVGVRGYVNSAPGFAAHTQVLDAASEVFLAALGPERGAHTRVAIGVASLPVNMALEIELTVAVSS